MPPEAKQNATIALLESVGAIVRKSHIVLSSGRHTDTYINKDAIYPHTSVTSLFAAEIAQQVRALNSTAVVGPAMGGIILAQWVAWHLSVIRGKTVYACYAEKQGEEFILSRGYDSLIKDKRTLVVEDVITTGAATRKTIQAVKESGGTVVGVAALCNRGTITESNLGIAHLSCLVSLPLATYDPEECPLCKQEIPINTTLGKGK
ncbi:MAG: phosphoribosyltransferase [Candidatus Spechtbacteria bacterium SB0662_bin_43]|uniref:Orotate phosphoribosyltransferase n=1 Tax=Candidatus Spechtbacteria bacterium SB0662_bin_43 TaxID=2604897 RepID=A0A845DAA8_9BACT|nr:phosphoribosyltransferase [Candidatus Spechtbacteria bacterium SB0662_bin_43]